MIKKLFPVVALLLGLAGGGGAAMLLAPPEAEQGMDDSAASAETSVAPSEKPGDGADGDTEIVKLPNQFVVPVILNNRVRAMVILAVALEVETGTGDKVRTLEPKLRDTFLAELFSLAAMGGFEDELISRKTLTLVKRALTERSKEVLGMDNATVLITDMARQDAF
ncbi:flagellar basal body-associated FliL family protein [Marivita sp.]|uniref:flagellar basal body-associated FliL family protein n=1 Tax=Marivita sp. TaxID=2003365 RepID=UPI0025C2E255|nr:flagellar basal body-associated FliL family protein [Marivita sp.]